MDRTLRFERFCPVRQVFGLSGLTANGRPELKVSSKVRSEFALLHKTVQAGMGKIKPL